MSALPERPHGDFGVGTISWGQRNGARSCQDGRRRVFYRIWAFLRIWPKPRWCSDFYYTRVPHWGHNLGISWNVQERGLNGLSRRDVKTLIGFFKGHCNQRSHIVTMGKGRLSLDEDQTARHILGKCPTVCQTLINTLATASRNILNNKKCLNPLFWEDRLLFLRIYTIAESWIWLYIDHCP